MRRSLSVWARWGGLGRNFPKPPYLFLDQDSIRFFQEVMSPLKHGLGISRFHSLWCQVCLGFVFFSFSFPPIVINPILSSMYFSSNVHPVSAKDTNILENRRGSNAEVLTVWTMKRTVPQRRMNRLNRSSKYCSQKIEKQGRDSSKHILYRPRK